MRTPFRSLRRWAGEERGSATVEFVIALPLTIMVLVMIAEFGRALWSYHIVTEGVRDAARYLSRAPRSEFSTYAERAQYLAMTGVADTSASPAYSWWTSADTVTVTGPDVLDDTGIFRTDFERVRVQAAVPLNLALLEIIGRESGLTISAADVARYIGD